MQALIDFFGIKDLIPHGYCLSWSPVLLWLHVTSDLLTTLAYYSIPLMLVYFIRQRKDFPYPWLVVMFAGFIVTCGTTHLLSAITIWIPLYWLDGVIKGFMAIISVATAALMLRIIPRALSLPSAAQLQAEIQQRKTAEEALRVTNVELQKNAAHTQSLIDSALDGIVSMDQNGNVIGWNAQAERIFGYSCEQALGRKIAALIVPPDYRERHRQGLSRFVSTGTSNIIGIRLEIIGMRADASEFPMELAIDVLGEKGSYFFSAFVRDITERKVAETAKQEVFDRLQKIASQLPGVVFQFRLRADGSSCLPYASEVLRDIYRIAPEQVRDDAAKVFAVVHPDDLDGHLASIQESARDLSPWRNEYRLRFADGTERWLFGNALPQREQDGSVLWHGVVTDITERKEAEELIHAAYQYSRSLIEASLDPLVTISAEGKITDVNTATEQVTGVDRDNLIGSDFADYFTDPKKAREGYQQVFSQGFVTDYPLVIRHVSGKVTDVLYNASVYRDGNDNVLGVFAAARDVTERKQAERISNQIKAMIDTSLDGFWIVDLMGNILQVNEAYAKISGYSINELVGMQICQLEALEEPEQIKTHIKKVVGQGYDLFETRHYHKDGHTIDIEVSVAFLPEFQQFCAFCRDITERKQMENELKASEAKFRSIIEVSPIPMAMNDEQMNITFLNSAFAHTFGYSRDDVPTLADWWMKAYPDPEYRDWVKTTWVTTLEQAKREQTDFPPMEVAVRCKDNSIKTVLATAVTIQHDFSGMNLAILYDITPLKQIEAELTRSNAELEQFAYAVSHDMRQPLRMVSSYLSLIENALTGQLNQETQQFLDFAVNGAKRMDAMILSLLDYSRIGRKSEAKTQISSKDALNEALAFLNPELGACNGEINVTGDWPELFASRDELTRLLQNLIGNALKYHEENQPPQVHVHGAIAASSLRVEVRDQGIGIEPSQIDRLFKVFSRLQAHSRFEGTGVGLALCRKIVEHHGGTIGVESAGEGQGCVFWFELPLMSISL